ncbi:MAG TPA: hypothetical protein VNF45_07955 [Candidatus Binataceae bacterium]|nr:hypothetical protein [Candidatus Binataceae bacterium]
MRGRASAALPRVGMLTHFTRRERVASALDKLELILREGVIRSSPRMVRGAREVVCMFDVPIAELRGLLDHKNRRRYEPFGVAIEKRYAFRMGARPVIYMPWREAERMLAPEEAWRVVNLELDRAAPIDWSFEHEWRLAGDLRLPGRGVVALVENWRDAEEIYDRFQGDPPCAGVIPLR